MDIKKFYTGFSKVCEILNKINIEKFVCSNGVFLGLENGILTSITFTEKIEKEILNIFAHKFEFDPYVIVFMKKYFDFINLEIHNDRIEFTYNTLDLSMASKDKNANDIFKCIRKDGKDYTVTIPFFKENLIYDNMLKIINNINNHIDHSQLKEFNIDIYNEITSSETPILIEEGKFSVRLSKNAFYHVVKGDKANIKFMPYKNDSIVFLVATTINKSEFQIINMFNAMYLIEGTE
jgi:hypothetical protein